MMIPVSSCSFSISCLMLVASVSQRLCWIFSPSLVSITFLISLYESSLLSGSMVFGSA